MSLFKKSGIDDKLVERIMNMSDEQWERMCARSPEEIAQEERAKKEAAERCIQEEIDNYKAILSDPTRVDINYYWTKSTISKYLDGTHARISKYMTDEMRNECKSLLAQRPSDEYFRLFKEEQKRKEKAEFQKSHPIKAFFYNISNKSK